ncbi:MAG: serine/threonine-protein kinase [Candidatus Moeniiplasma glomeromycotorum]|nr:serine/threonine-protein kinase [Candidatus Moeniiplasma glomeromycotorum]MCE8167573.1 serine/threonine-protein kinase [Candidatus Moeniiplasma glomeromycotorum]MCE8169075.1 serine/threonine-protein kinase [Candidatus Moeniiplasma glomeromycotorum]
MTNWQNIHPYFVIPKFKKEWEERGFVVEEVKNWIKVGLNPMEVDYTEWLKKVKYSCDEFSDDEFDDDYYQELPIIRYQEWLSIHSNDQELRAEYQKYKKWVDIHHDFNDWQSYWKDLGFALQEVKSWIEAGLKPSNAELVAYARYKDYQPSQINREKLSEEYKEWEKTPKPTQEYLDIFYPLEKRELKKEIDISYKDLTGELDLSDFKNLEKLSCYSNKLTSLNLNNCSQLERVNCWGNLLTNLILPQNSTNLKWLNLSNNNFPPQNLSFLATAINLEELRLGNNKFIGSLDYLSGMEKLKELCIDDTDLNEVNLDKLPRSLRRIDYSTKRPDCKLIAIIPQLKKYRWGFCQECRQPNTSEKWCQPCEEKELGNLSGRKLIEKFIQRKPGYGGLQWIPYEKFNEIEYLAEGGFSRVYKANLEKWLHDRWDKMVVLKSLNNSQNITLEFLREIANTKLVERFKGGNNVSAFLRNNNIVECHGISQDPITKNYVMVMSYMEGGNLRQYLQNKVGDLSFKNKLGKLSVIVSGLNSIHEQNLVHRDFHSGNILGSYITDLGLSQPVSYQKKEGEIFGVLPYVAPEVLRGQPYTQESDTYSWGIIVYELFANAYPYPKLDSMDLTLKICRGLRPNIDEVPIPQLLKDLIKKCWDIDPTKRPSAEELERFIGSWREPRGEVKENTPFYQQYQEIETKYNTFSQNTPYKIHPAAVLTSKMIDTKQINKQLDSLNLSDKINIQKSKEVFLKESEEIVPIEIKEKQFQTQVEIPPK